jgi:hypothetical protein
MVFVAFQIVKNCATAPERKHVSFVFSEPLFQKKLAREVSIEINDAWTRGFLPLSTSFFE